MKKEQTILAILLSTGIAFAQDVPTPATTFAGSADMYYKYDLANRTGNGKTCFTNSHNSFELGMASIEATHKKGKGAVFVDLGFGNRAKEFAYNDKPSSFMIKQLTFTYDFSDKFKVVAGSFATHIGYELLDAVDNKNYSVSYDFANGPFFNTGVKAQYTLGKCSFMAGVTDPTDFKTTIEAGSTQKTFIGQFAYTVDSGSAFFNVTSGSTNPATTTNKTEFDVVLTKKVSDKFSLAFNGSYTFINDDLNGANDEKWFALVGYASYAAKDNLSMAYRLEYFDATAASVNLASLGGSNIVGNTFSLNYKAGNLTIIPEFRIDLSSEDIFLNKDENPTGSNAYFLLATTYSF